jgi:hypothetical protein
LLEHGLDQSSFLKLEVLVSSWHKQFPLENCCTWTLSAASIYRDYLADKESEVKMTVSKEIACLSVSARLLSRKDVKNHD